MSIYDKLNEPQREAVYHTDGPLLILAGAGSGKTRVLTHRIAYLIGERGVNAWNILAITFTNKAAEEMRQRVDNLVGFGAESVWVSTFHSACVRILRRFIDRLGYENHFTIYDTDDQKTLIKEVCRKVDVDTKVFKERSLLSAISSAKNEMILPDEFELNAGGDFAKMKIAKVYREYEAQMKANNALDFDDLLVKTVQLLQTQPDVLESYQERFRYIMVDEYQDTNTVQFQLVSLLAGKYKNLCVVGDDDQSIYGFRGAKPEIMLKFAEHYPNAVSLHLSMNYRSDRKIIECASNLIHHNKERFDKKFLASHEEEGIVHHQTYNDIDAEQRGLVKMILEKKMSMDEYRNTSILYRTNKEAVQVSDLLITEKIPFWCTEPIQDKYDHWIYRDILSYHKLGNGIGNKMDLNRILNHPQRFLFDSRFFKTDGSLKQLMHVAATLPDGKWKRSKAMDSVEDMFYLFKKLEDKNPVDTLKILESFGRYKIFLHDYAEYRNMSPGELYFYWNSYKADAEKHNDWKEWDAYVRKHKIILQEQLRKHDGIALSTLHRSKGLEWDRVYILNCVKNTIPFAKQGTVEDLEEERRLFYVGCTRAKKELQLLSYQGNSGEISPFIKELKSSESDTGDKVDLDVHLKY